MSQSDAVKKLNDALNLIKEAINSQTCALCKEELELVAKGLESAIVKQSRLGQMVEEMQQKGILDAEDKLREKYGVKQSDGLGVSDLFSDLADVIDDVRELQNALEPLKELNPIKLASSVLPNPLDPLGLLSRKNRPPLPHELLFGGK
jgi:hypothetical protein